MKVENRPGTGPEPLRARRDEKLERAEARPRAGEDRIELSPLARSVSRLVQEVGDVRAVDAPRVVELRERIAAGYEPADEEVARSLLRGIVDEET